MKALFERLHKDEGGNVIVLYVAASLLLVGMLWAIIGTGARMVQKETIQSSSDAAAFSAAVIKAKGMNIIAFCNLVMALLLAIVMLLRMVKIALGVLMGITAAACVATFFFPGAAALCAFAPTATSMYNTYSRIQEQVEPRLFDAMRGMAKLERAINKTFPALSLVEAYRVGTHSHYQKNFGGGSLVTISWPLPIGKDLSLPTKDGTFDKLCDEATNTIGRVIDAALEKMGLPGIIRSTLSGLLTTAMRPVQGLLCGGGPSTMMVDTHERRTNCSQCSGAYASEWSGQRVVRNPDGTFNSFPPGVCQLDYMPMYLCGGTSGFTRCSDGNEYRNLRFVACAVKTRKEADLGPGISGNKPIPLELADDYAQRKFVRAFTLLSDTKMGERRQSVQVGVKNKSGAPMLNQMLGMAQAEFFAWNSHEDLWHMNWRARLVRFTFGNDSGTDVGEAGSQGVPSGGAQAITDKVKEFMMKDGAAVLADQFLLH